MLGCTASLALAGCGSPVPEGAIVLTQSPTMSAAAEKPGTILDSRYAPGSRVVLVQPPFRPSEARVLSKGLAAAGGAVVSPDGKRAVFAGKAATSAAWQIYEVSLSGGNARRLTSMPEGAMDPAILGNGDVVFSSPVPRAGELWKTETPPALYAQASGGAPRRLTFGTTAAVEPTVLADGRILFVSTAPGVKWCDEAPRLALFTINNDGTELTTFGLDGPGAGIVHRPRELPDGRIAFVAADEQRDFRPEAVRKARPFASRAPLWTFACRGCRSIEPDGDRTVLACLDTRGLVGRSMASSVAVFRIGTDSHLVGEPLFHETAWNQVEAVPVMRRPNPTGHLSAMAPEKKTGTILCLDAKFTRDSATGAGATSKAQRVRILAGRGGDQVLALGEVALAQDGSFMAEVPADTPLGFETLDANGAVLQRLAPALWVRPGENRSCIGCHEPYNRSPRNHRPLAAGMAPATLNGAGQVPASGGAR